MKPLNSKRYSPLEAIIAGAELMGEAVDRDPVGFHDTNRARVEELKLEMRKEVNGTDQDHWEVGLREVQHAIYDLEDMADEQEEREWDRWLHLLDHEGPVQ